MDTNKSDEDEIDTFETIAPGKDIPVRKEFEIGQLGMRSLKKMKLPEMKHLMVHPVILNLPSEILMLRVQIPYKASGKPEAGF
jgi:hypothetical protein